MVLGYIEDSRSGPGLAFEGCLYLTSPHASSGFLALTVAESGRQN